MSDEVSGPSAEDEYQSGIADATAKRLTASEVIRATAEGLGLDPELMTLPPGTFIAPGGWSVPYGHPIYRVGPSDELVKAEAEHVQFTRGGIRYGDTGPGTSVGKPIVPGTTWQESMGIEPEYRHGDDDPIVRTIAASDGTIIDSDGTDTHTRVWFDLHESGNVTWSTR